MTTTSPYRFTPAYFLPVSSREPIAEEVNRVCEVEPLSVKHTITSPSDKKLNGIKGNKMRLTHSEVIGQNGEHDKYYPYTLLWFMWYKVDYDEVLLSAFRYSDVWYKNFGK